MTENTELSKDGWVKGAGQLPKEETIKWRTNGLDPSGRGQKLREAAGLLNTLAIPSKCRWYRVARPQNQDSPKTIKMSNLKPLQKSPCTLG